MLDSYFYDQKKKKVTIRTIGKRKPDRSSQKEIVTNEIVVFENTQIKPIATTLVGVAILQATKDNFIQMTQRIHDYEEDAKKMRDDLIERKG